MTLGLSACDMGPPAGTAAGSSGGVVPVVAAESFWGSIASQVGGTRVHVTSIVSNPDSDPHSYEPTPADARAMAEARLVIYNGIGYDPWAPKLLAADNGSAAVLDVGRALGVADNSNPHRWYDPQAVVDVSYRIVADLQRVDPADRAYFASQGRAFVSGGLHGYLAEIAAIRARYHGTPVGASESIFSMQAPALGLDVITPYPFLRAISEGTDVSAGDKASIDRQIRTHQIRIYVYNSQNVTPDVRDQLDEVRAAHIPYATITETLSPPNATFQAWQLRQLQGIAAALAQAEGSGA